MHKKDALVYALVLKQMSCVESFVDEVETVIIVNLETLTMTFAYVSFCIIFWFHN